MDRFAFTLLLRLAYVLAATVVILAAYKSINNQQQPASLADACVQQRDAKGVHSPYKIRLLCWVLTNPKTHDTQARAIKETWGNRCDKLIFMSNLEDTELGALNLNVAEGRQNTWAKTRSAFEYLFANHLEEFDWFYKADDDTYTIVDNLRYMLSPYDPDDPISFGMVFNRSRKVYLAGGAGYTVSRGALRNLGEIAFKDPHLCRETLSGSGEDVKFGNCLVNAGVTMGDSRDSEGRNRFFQHTPENYIAGKYENWHPGTVKYKIGKGLEMMSDTAISFHKFKTTASIYQMHYLIYKLRIINFCHTTVDPWPAPLAPDIQVIPAKVLERYGHPALQAKESADEPIETPKSDFLEGLEDP